MVAEATEATEAMEPTVGETLCPYLLVLVSVSVEAEADRRR